MANLASWLSNSNRFSYLFFHLPEDRELILLMLKCSGPQPWVNKLLSKSGFIPSLPKNLIMSTFGKYKRMVFRWLRFSLSSCSFASPKLSMKSKVVHSVLKNRSSSVFFRDILEHTGAEL
ncbi:unnamed protein product [Moneuplotes crassus]|uniref:Uncharacterized protein n=1 Tax=Euplotes crassus TaxID=5936 RepID=A0AAD2DBB5_EUPCR|nr:unnamed protein product [Moneuplotes crassus]